MSSDAAGGPADAAVLHERYDGRIGSGVTCTRRER
jgi:hypothetical protein